MHTPRRPRCQTALATFVLGWFGVASLGAFRPVQAAEASPAPATAATSPRPSSPAQPSPDAWRGELDGLRLAESAAALADSQPGADPKLVALRRQRLDALYRQLAERYPQQAEIHRARGDFYWKNDQAAEATLCWQRAQALAPGDAEAAESLGSAYLRAGRARDAAAQYRRAVAARPDQPFYHYELANVLHVFRRELTDPPALPDAEAVLRQAQEHFRRAAELAPTNVDLVKAYAETFYVVAQPDWQAALGAWLAVRTLSGPDTDFANGHLARVSLRLGRPSEARQYLAAIKNPAFAAMKTQLLKQADKTAVKPPGAATLP